MPFIVLGVQLISLKLQQSELQFREVIVTNEKETVTSELANMPSDVDTDSAQYKGLEQLKEQYDTEINTIESQLKEINSEIDSFQKGIDQNIKTDGAFKL